MLGKFADAGGSPAGAAGGNEPADDAASARFFSFAASACTSDTPNPFRLASRRRFRCSRAASTAVKCRSHLSRSNAGRFPSAIASFFRSQSSKVSWPENDSAGSHVHRSMGYPAHFTRYNVSPSSPSVRSVRIVSTSCSDSGSLGTVEVTETSSSSSAMSLPWLCHYHPPSFSSSFLPRLLFDQVILSSPLT